MNLKLCYINLLTLHLGLYPAPVVQSHAPPHIGFILKFESLPCRDSQARLSFFSMKCEDLFAEEVSISSSATFFGMLFGSVSSEAQATAQLPQHLS